MTPVVPSGGGARRRGPAGRCEWSTLGQALSLFVHGATVVVAGRVAVIVGTILSAVNQGSVIAGGHGTWATWVRVVVNYATPFVVTSVGYLAGCRVGTNSGPDDERQQ